MMPFEIKLDSAINYEDVHNALVNNCENNKYFDYSDKSAFFMLKKKYNVRVILYSTEFFNKKEYDEEKKRINRKANKIYNIHHWGAINSLRKQMRVNLICAEEINDTLFNFISADAGIFLTRVEGIISIVVSKDKLIVPPLEPNVYLYAIDRYRAMVKMILKLLEE